MSFAANIDVEAAEFSVDFDKAIDDTSVSLYNLLKGGNSVEVYVTLMQSTFDSNLEFNGKELTELTLVVLPSDEWKKEKENLFAVSPKTAGHAELWFTSSESELVYRIQFHVCGTNYELSASHPTTCIKVATTSVDTSVKIILVVIGVLLVLSVAFAAKTYREKQDIGKIYHETQIKNTNLKKDNEEMTLAENIMRLSMTKLKHNNVDLQTKLDRAVQYSKAEVDLLNNKLKDFEELGRTKTRTSTNIEGETANGIRRASSVLHVDGNESRLSKLRYHSSEVVFDPSNMIGRGSFGEVFKGTFHDKDVAVKTLKKVNEENLGRFKLEVLLMASIHHTNITFLLGMCWDEDLIGLMMEYADLGSLTTVLIAANAKTYFEWNDPLLKYVTDIACGLHYLHNVKYYDYNERKSKTSIIHRDVKLDNVLVFSQVGTSHGTCKLTDFGESRAVSIDETMTAVGSPLYMAPEVIKGEQYTLKADVFSFGMLVLAVSLKGEIPLAKYVREAYAKQFKRSFKMSSLGVISHGIISGWRPVAPLNEDESPMQPDSIHHMIELCWSKNVDERPDMAQVVSHLIDVVKPIVNCEDGGGKEGLFANATGKQKQTRILYKFSELLSSVKDRKVVKEIVELHQHEEWREEILEMIEAKWESEDDMAKEGDQIEKPVAQGKPVGYEFEKVETF